MRALRGNRIAMIFQDPMMTLNPVLRIDTQMIEAVRAHQAVAREQRARASRDALGAVGIPSPDERLRCLSAPVLRRHAPARRDRDRAAATTRLIIADEPTTALDVTIQAQILAEVQKLARETGTALIWITHDLSVIAGLADDIARHVRWPHRRIGRGRTTCSTSRCIRIPHGLIGSGAEPQPARRAAARRFPA